MKYLFAVGIILALTVTFTVNLLWPRFSSWQRSRRWAEWSRVVDRPHLKAVKPGAAYDDLWETESADRPLPTVVVPVAHAHVPAPDKNYVPPWLRAGEQTGVNRCD